MTEQPLLAAPPDVIDDDPLVTTLMTREVVAVESRADTGTALRTMADHGVRHLVLRDGDRAVGAVTEASIVRAIADDRSADPVRRLRVPLPSTGPAARRSDAARAMVEHRVDAVLVVDDGEVLGILTATDLLKSLARPEV
ncbi:CBS domain-containing protein [Pseudonocardia sp. CA-107938]|uniref:CBS domain-containing protein n=1 Tax=Pseudonocardia sp. CA-107938 TaxID=3240021 RepID=UPI003D8B88B4